MLETIQALFSKKIKTENKITLFDYQESALSQYTIKSGGSYDQDFTEQIKKITPSWFKS